MEEFQTGILTPERLKPLQKYLDDEAVTNIDYNGTELWIKDTSNRCYRIDDEEVTYEYINSLIAHIANSKGKRFNYEENVLETENEELHIRVTAVHDSIALNGNSLMIRKTTAKSRFTYDGLVKSGYADMQTLNLLINCIKSGCNVMIAGVPEAGKSEFGKYLSLYIPDNEVVVTIEDSAEWFYKKLKPDAACMALKTNDVFDYTQAIKLCMRLNPGRILFTEVRGSEVSDLVSLWTTGVPGISTIHAGNYRSIPDRILNLMPKDANLMQFENNIFENLDVGVVIRKRKMPDGTAERFIDEIGFFERSCGYNVCHDYLIKGNAVTDKIPDSIIEKMKSVNITNPFHLDRREKR